MNVLIYNAKNEAVLIPYFQLLQWKGCINLESKGLKHSRGSVTQHVRNLLGTTPRYKRHLLLSHLERTIEAAIHHTNPPQFDIRSDVGDDFTEQCRLANEHANK